MCSSSDYLSNSEMAPPGEKGRGFIQQRIQELQPRSASPQKRRRKTSGELAETGTCELREMLEQQMTEFSKLRDEFQSIADMMKTELGSLRERVRDLEEHTNRKEEEMERTKDGKHLRKCVMLSKSKCMQVVISRLPTLVFSGPAVLKSAPPRRPAAAAGARILYLRFTCGSAAKKISNQTKTNIT